MLNLIFGPSGSGKTALLRERIRADIEMGRRAILLVPEQQAYISEQDFCASLPPSAGRFFEVASFSRLADAVFRQTGGVALGSLEHGMHNLLMWDTLRELSPLLHQYGKNARGDATLTALMLQTLSELHSSGVSAEQLENAANALPPESPLQKKLLDLALVDSVYHQRLVDTFGDDPAERLARMTARLKETPIFADCRIYVDSFTSFTAQEYDVLRELLRQCEEITVALCSDGYSSRLPHLESVNKTAQRLSKLANLTDTPVKRTVLSPDPGKRPEALRFLAEEIWHFEGKRPSPPENSDAVTLLSCTNLYEEAEAAALQILALVQEGMRYGDIAVIVRDTETYRGVLDAALERHGIPYFLSERTDLSAKPLARLILSALRAVSRNYHVKDVMTLAKTGLTGLSQKDVALFEEYCETWHISGSRFLDPIWSMNPDGLTTERSPRTEEILTAANRARKHLIDPLRHLSSNLRASKRMVDRCRALYDYLIEMSIPDLLSSRAKEEIAKGQLRHAGETLRLYRLLTDTLTGMANLLPESELSVEEFLSALSLLLSGSDIGSVPNTHDCVVIGSAATLRIENIRATILLGLCEGEFPRAITDDGMLSEADKSALEEVGILLDSRESIRNSEELFYVYRAISKPTDRLMLSTCARLPDGSARTPSLAFNRARLLLDREAEPFDRSMLRTLKEANAREILPMSLASALPGASLRLSQSKIRTFVLCPYSYYSTYRLQLREKKDSTPSYADDGTFLHHVFEQFLLSCLSSDGRAILLPDHEEAERLADRIIEHYLEAVCPISANQMDRRLLHLFSRLRKLALLMLDEICAELKQSKFVPSAFEQVIGRDGENGLPPVTLTLKNGSTVTLSGMIDRVDLLRQDGKTYLRVVDYKSGKHVFSPEDVRSGLDVQLVLYLQAALSKPNEEYTAAGAQFLYANNEKGKIEICRSGFLLDDEAVKEAADATEGRLFTKKLSLQSAEEIDALAEDMKSAVRSVAERILAGEAEKTPSKEACLFCPVKESCDRAYRE